MRTAACSMLPGTWRPWVHAVCPHNEIAALLLRSLSPLPPMVMSGRLGNVVSKQFSVLRRLARSYDGNVWTHLQTAMSYNGRLRRRYLEAERSLRVDGPIGFEDYYLRPFLKAEKFNAAAKLAKPRMIFPRSPRYNLALASWLKPFEHWLWGRLTARKFLRGTGVGRIVAKGLNPRQRANLIVRKFRALDDAVVVEVDGKSWESHVGLAQIIQEHSVYKAAYPGSRELDYLLCKQHTLEGKLQCGAKFSREGGRASGDFNTGMGNSIIMLCIVVGVLQSLTDKFDLLVDGDNAIVFLPRQTFSRVMSVFAQHVLDVSGHELTLEKPVDYVEGIVFGQSHPVYLGARYGWTMVRDPRKVMSNALSSHRWLKEEKFAREWARGVAACELSLALGVPVLQAWSSALQRHLGGPEGVRAHPHTDYFYQGAWFAGLADRREVSPETRVSYERAFGISPEEQLYMESVDPCQGLGKPWVRHNPGDSDLWNTDPGLFETFVDLSL